MNYEFLLWIALILISTKVLGLLCKAVHLPEVVGALLAGVILGPSALGLMSMEGDTGTLLTYVAEMGVIFLMFSAGLDTDLKELKANIGASFVTAFKIFSEFSFASNTKDFTFFVLLIFALEQYITSKSA